MTDPKKQHVIGKKPIVAERTLTERSFCEIDQYYYSEMFTCPICYGRDTEQERIVELLDNPLHHNIQSPDIHKDCYTCVLVALIKGEQK